MRNNHFSTILLSTLVSLVCLSSYHLVFQHNKNRSAAEESNKTPVYFTSYHGITDSKPEGDFSSAAERAMPAVVHIKSMMAVQNYYDPWSDFFGWGGMQQRQQRSAESSGSGVIVNKDGYIVTNNHVIKDAENITVTLYDNRTFDAEVIGSDPSSDLGVIRIKAEHLSPIEFANSDEARVGQWVIAVGNPFNLSSTVTAGIVSAIGRNLEIIKDKAAIESFIQTDAAVNPGNSGGALVDLQGKLVGVNTAISSPTGAYAGYAFAIPANIVRKNVEDIIQYGAVQRVFLGIGRISTLNNIEAEKNDLAIEEGLLIQSLNPSGSAARAGVQVGDVIQKIDGVAIKTEAKLMESIAKHRPGETAKMLVYRDGKEKIIDILLRNQQGTTDVVRRSARMQQLGIEVTDLDDRTRKQYNIDYGVKVSRLSAGKIRQSTDMPEGFVILELNDKKVKTEQEVTDIFESAKGKVSIEGFVPGYYVNGRLLTGSYSVEVD